MNELALSDDLNVITAEINSYKQVAGQAIFEIGKRLKHVKENDLVHGEWKIFLESTKMSKSQADRFMRVYSEFETGKLPDVGNIALSVLYEIATLPEPEREKEHTLPSGETKTPDEMTVRELQEVKRQLKKAREAEADALERLKNTEKRSAEIIEREVIKEVVPDEIQRSILEKEEALQRLEEQITNQKDEIRILKNSKSSDEKSRQEELKYLNYEANKTTLTLKLQIDDFLKEAAITAFRRGALAGSSDGTKEKLFQGIEELKDFCRAMEAALNNRIILRGGEVHD